MFSWYRIYISFFLLFNFGCSARYIYFFSDKNVDTPKILMDTSGTGDYRTTVRSGTADFVAISETAIFQ